MLLSSRRFFLFSLSVAILGGSLWWTRVHEKAPAPGKSTDLYWSETGLDSYALEDLLDTPTCSSSERYFLACANAVLAVANRYNLTVDQQGRVLSSKDAFAQDLSTEKKQLAAWKKFFNENTSEATRFSFMDVWKKLENKHVPANQKSLMVGTALNGFISVFRDPHTYLMPVAMFKEVVSRADSRLTTAGVQVGRLNGNYVIRKVLPGSAAERAELRRGDLILEIDGKNVHSLLQARVTELLKGEEGTKVSLLIQRDGHEIKKKLERTEIIVATLTTQIIDGIKPIGVIGLNKFAKGSCDKMKGALDVVNKAHVRGLLLDLRDNPGGQMEEAACIASLFVGADKKIFDIRYLDPTKKSEEYFGGEPQIFDKPVAVLINAGSASAAEIVAGALRDLNRAVLVGERTFGKGSFQEGEYWTQNKKIALFETKGFYYLPSGRSPQMKGLSPDVAVNFDMISVDREEDQFVNPLLAPERHVRSLKSLISSKDCLESEDATSNEDVQMKKARQVLFCSKAIAGVN
ncbi:S41 family peptidase [Bdellovibrio sp. HCB209]|uniref:S41 family peptidase n=1 Tax=Bdellovibrio sp. HCB209 TaxID=3394354 RepID=UPI0039B4D45F